MNAKFSLAFDPGTNKFKSPQLCCEADTALIKHSTEARVARIQRHSLAAKR